MKKITLLILAILCVCSFVFGLTACNNDNNTTDSSSVQSNTTDSVNSGSQGQEPNSGSQGQAPNSSSSGGGSDVPPTVKHEHSYGEWVYDETNHWKACTSIEGECDTPKASIEKHSFNSENGQCTVCQFQQGVTLSYTTVYENDRLVAYSVTGIETKDATVVTIPFEYNGKPVTSIGSSAFKNCENLTSVTIPDSVTSIDREAFYHCIGLTNVKIGNGVTSIGYYVFSGCSKLEKLTIGNSVASIGLSAFSGCKSLRSVTLPDSVTSVDENVFRDCESLTSVTIGNGLTSLGDSMFYGCESLTSVTMGEKVTSIGSYAFHWCSKLNEITIPDSVTSISSFAFSSCSGLNKVNIDNLSAWCKIQFSGSNSNPLEYAKNLYLKGELVTNLVIPSDITSIESFAFQSCESLTGVTIHNGVTSIGSYAFDGCSNITNITLPNSVTTIGGYAFKDCARLTSITIGSGVTSIGDWAFNGCANLTSVNITDLSAWCKIKFSDTDANPLSRAKNLYLNGELITNLVIPNDITSIKDYAFANYKSLISVTIPDSVTSIGEKAFYWCDSLQSASIGDKVTSIESEAFQYCNSLKSLTLGNSVTSIGYNAFYGCDKLTSITLPKSLTSIKDNAFMGCVKLLEVCNLSSLNIIKGSDNNGRVAYYALVVSTSSDTPGKISTTEDGFVFYENGEEVLLVSYDGSETNLVLPDKFNNKNYAIYERIFSSNNTLTSVTIPDSVTSIGDLAFYECEALTSVTIGNGVTSIGVWAFEHCENLTSVTMGKGITSIGDDAFDWCNSLKSVNITDLSAWCKIKFSNNESNPLSCAGNLYLNGELVTDLVIPTGITSIENYVFSECESLTSVTIPNSVTTIGAQAFQWCENIKRVNIDSLSAWCKIKFGDSNANPLFCGKNLYLNGELVTNLVIPDDITSIEESAFYGCESLRSVTIGKQVTSIGNYAFMDCFKLVEVYNLSTLTITKGSYENGYVAYHALGVHTSKDILSKLSTTTDGFVFYENGEEVYLVGYEGKETNLVLPEKFNNKNYVINKYAFYNCDSIISVTIPNSVTSIGENAFEYCRNLASVTIGSGVTYIGKFAFGGCVKLASLTFVDTANWYIGGSSVADRGETLTDPSANAQYLRSTYSYFTWEKKQV